MSAAPYYTDELVTLWLDDCREVTDWLAADVLITDPPYGRAWTRGNYANGKSGSGARHAGIENDGSTDVRDEALALWAQSKIGLVFGSPLAAPPLGARAALVWQKPAGSGLFAALGGWRRDTELVYLVGDWAQQKPERSSVVQTNGALQHYLTGDHPHAKPIALLEHLASHCGTGTIADPFAGIGSTLVAAKRLGRQCFGVEVDERYCEIAAERLSQGVLDFGGVVA